MYSLLIISMKTIITIVPNQYIFKYTRIIDALKARVI